MFWGLNSILVSSPTLKKGQLSTFVYTTTYHRLNSKMQEQTIHNILSKKQFIICLIRLAIKESFAKFGSIPLQNYNLTTNAALKWGINILIETCEYEMCPISTEQEVKNCPLKYLLLFGQTSKISLINYIKSGFRAKYILLQFFPY